MEYKDLEKKSVNELNKILSEERGTLYDLELKVSINQLKNVRSLRAAKKNIARIQTAIANGSKDLKVEVTK